MVIKEFDNLCIIVMKNCRKLGNQINKEIQKIRKIKKEYLVAIDEVRFNNSEGKIKINNSVRGKDVFILSDVGNYNCSYEAYGKIRFMGADEHYQDIKRVISAISGNADRIHVIMPLLYQSRQDNRNGRESLDCAICLKELENMGVKTIITFDVHNPGVQNAIPLTSFENFFPTKIVLTNFIKENLIDFDKLLVIAPDKGAMERAIFYANMLGCDVGMFYKRRDYSVLKEGKNPIVEHKYLGKEEDDLEYIIVDDMIASGDSIVDVLKELKKRKAKNIYAISTFAFFTKGTSIFDKAYNDGLFTKMYVPNLSYIPNEIKEKAWFREVNCSNFLAEIIDTLNTKKSIAPLLNGKLELFKEIQAHKETN